MFGKKRYELKRKRQESRPFDTIYKSKDGFLTCEFQSDVTDQQAVERFWYLCRLFMQANTIDGIDLFYPVVCISNDLNANEKWKGNIYIPVASIKTEMDILVLFKKNGFGGSTSINSWSMLGCICKNSPALMFANVLGYGKMVMNIRLEEDYKCIPIIHLKSNITSLISEARHVDAIDVCGDGDVGDAAPDPVHYIPLLFFDQYDLRTELETGLQEFVVTSAINIRLDCIFVNYKKKNIMQWMPFALEHPRECMMAEFLICIIACVMSRLKEMYINGYSTWAGIAMKKIKDPYAKQQSFLRNGFNIEEDRLRDKYNQNCVGYFYDLTRQRCLDNVAACMKKYQITDENPTGIFGDMDETRYSRLSTLLRSILAACESRLEQQ